MKVVYLAATLAILTLPTASALKVYLKKIPNGDTFTQELGHPDMDETKFTAFAEAFKAVELTWTTDFCNAKFPGSETTNGAAFGDPCCTWKSGATPDSTVKAFTTTPGERTVCKTAVSPAPVAAPATTPASPVATKAPAATPTATKTPTATPTATKAPDATPTATKAPTATKSPVAPTTPAPGDGYDGDDDETETPETPTTPVPNDDGDGDETETPATTTAPSSSAKPTPSSDDAKIPGKGCTIKDKGDKNGKGDKSDKGGKGDKSDKGDKGGYPGMGGSNSTSGWGGKGHGWGWGWGKSKGGKNSTMPTTMPKTVTPRDDEEED